MYYIGFLPPIIYSSGSILYALSPGRRVKEHPDTDEFPTAGATKEKLFYKYYSYFKQIVFQTDLYSAALCFHKALHNGKAETGALRIS